MKKIVLFLALSIIWCTNINAADRDCAKYTHAQAIAATSNGRHNTFSVTFSDITSRQRTTNADCVTAAVETPSSTQETSKNSSENTETPPNDPSGPFFPGAYQEQEL